MERLAPDIRVSCNASVLPNLGDQLWHISNDVDEKERMYGTILRSTATQTWVIRLDYDDSLVVMKSHQLQNESGLRGICEVISVDYDDSLGTESQLFDDSVTSVTADEAETVEVGGVVWHYTPGQQCKTDSSRLEGRARPTVEGVNFSLKMDLDEGFWKFFPFTPQHICDHVNPILKEHKKRETTQKEVVTWFALFVGASLYDETGTDLFTRPADDVKQKQTDCPNFQRYMKYARFNVLKTHMLAPFMDANSDWLIDPLIHAFNKLRAGMVKGGTVKCNDETMSAFRPRASKAANLPKLTHCPRKPEPLGTELKSMADAETKIMQYLEIQKKPAEMAVLPYRQFGARVACTMRLTQNQSDMKTGLFSKMHGLAALRILQH